MKPEKNPSELHVTAYEEQATEERRSFSDRILRRPRRATVEEMGGPEPLPLIAGHFAGPDLSLSAFLGQERMIMPGHDAGAVERSRVERPQKGLTKRSPFVSSPDEEVAGIGVQRSPYV